MFGLPPKDGAPSSGMISMLAGMMGVTPQDLQEGVAKVQGAILETAERLKRIEAKQDAQMRMQGMDPENDSDSYRARNPAE